MKLLPQRCDDRKCIYNVPEIPESNEENLCRPISISGLEDIGFYFPVDRRFVQGPPGLAVTRIQLEAFDEVQVCGSRVFESRLDAAEVIFRCIPITVIRAMKDELEQSPGFIQFTDGFKMRSLLVDCDRAGIVRVSPDLTDILQSLGNAVLKVVPANMTIQRSGACGKYGGSGLFQQGN